MIACHSWPERERLPTLHCCVRCRRSKGSNGDGSGSRYSSVWSDGLLVLRVEVSADELGAQIQPHESLLICAS